jgi:hypothetical protein
MPSRRSRLRNTAGEVSTLEDICRGYQPGAVIAAGVLAALSSAGCGTTRERHGVSRAQFIASANAVCGFEQTKLAYIEGRARRLRRADSTPAVIRQRAAQSQLATARLEALPEPPGDGRAIGQWLTARTVAATVALDLAEAPPTGDATAVSDVKAQLLTARSRAHALALAYGSQVCSATD